jgi:ribosomal protein S18 acetylase RimI-like enzyme
MVDPVAITFLPAGTADIPIIQDLAARIWRQHYPGIITHAQIDYMLERMYATSVIENEMTRQGYRYYVANEGTVPVGFVAYRYDGSDSSVKISKLYLVPSHHGRGVGQQLLAITKADAGQLGAKKLTLFVNKRNGKAIKAYERFGFVKAEEVVTDIGGGFVMDDYRMDLSLA